MVTLMQNDYFNLARVVGYLEKFESRVKFELVYAGGYWHGKILRQKKTEEYAIIFEATDKNFGDMMDYIAQYCLERMLDNNLGPWKPLLHVVHTEGEPRAVGIPAMHTENAAERLTTAHEQMDHLANDAMQRQFNEAADAVVDQQIGRRECEPECNPSSFMFCSEECEAEAKAAKTRQGRFEVHTPDLDQQPRDSMPVLDLGAPKPDGLKKFAQSMPSLDMTIGQPWPPANIELGNE